MEGDRGGVAPGVVFGRPAPSPGGAAATDQRTPAQVSQARKQSRNAQMRLFNIVHPPHDVGVFGKEALS